MMRLFGRQLESFFSNDEAIRTPTRLAKDKK